jgi:hypothetical protein
VTGFAETERRFMCSDGWELGGIVRMPEPAEGPVATILMVPDSFHERDVYESLASRLDSVTLASVRLDIRGRGASRGATPYARMGPQQRRRVADDVRSSLEQLSTVDGLASDRLGVVAERNTAPDVVAGAAGQVGGVVVLGAWPARRMIEALREHPVPVLGLVSAEDRLGLRGTADAFLAGSAAGSRIEVLHRRGFGTTMFSTGRGSSLERVIAAWFAEVLS